MGTNNSRDRTRMNVADDRRDAIFPVMRKIFNSILNPKQNKNPILALIPNGLRELLLSENLAMRAMSIRVVMDRIVAHMDGPKSIVALAYTSPRLTMTVLDSVRKQDCVLRISYSFANTGSSYYNLEDWMKRLYLNGSAKIYGKNTFQMPTEVMLRIPSLIVESHYIRISVDVSEVHHIASRTISTDQWFTICCCRNVNKINFTFVTIEEDFMKPWLSQMNWPFLKEVRIESVSAGPAERYSRLVDLNFIKNLYVPPELVIRLASQPNVEKMELISLYINKETVSRMEDVAQDNLKKVRILHLEDLIIEEGCESKFDNVMLKIIQANTFCSLTLALHENYFGRSLLETIIREGVKITSLRLIINLKETDAFMFKTITNLHTLCEDIKLTFYHPNSFNGFYPIDEEMEMEMEKWVKVSEVILGKTLFPYLTENAVFNGPTYHDYLRHVKLIPNLKSFGIKERIDEFVMGFLIDFFQNSNFEGITLGLSAEHEMRLYNELLNAIQVGVKSLSLLFYPMDENGEKELVKHASTLEDLTYYQLRTMKRTRKQMDAVLPNTEKDMKDWLSNTPGLYRMSTISYFFDPYLPDN